MLFLWGRAPRLLMEFGASGLSKALFLRLIGARAQAVAILTCWYMCVCMYVRMYLP